MKKSKIKLVFRGISEIVGDEKVGILMLTDEQNMRQLSVVCDRQTVELLSLRIEQAPDTDRRLPEVLCEALRAQGVIDQYEVVIVGIAQGEYQAVLFNHTTMDMVRMRACDGVLLSLISDIPVFVESGLMAQQGIPFTEDARSMSIPVNSLSREMLEQALDRALASENYERASFLRDELNKRKQ